MPVPDRELEMLEGTVERIIFTNDENQYTVAALVPETRGRAEPLMRAGEWAQPPG